MTPQGKKLGHQGSESSPSPFYREENIFHRPWVFCSSHAAWWDHRNSLTEGHWERTLWLEVGSGKGLGWRDLNDGVWLKAMKKTDRCNSDITPRFSMHRSKVVSPLVGGGGEDKLKRVSRWETKAKKINQPNEETISNHPRPMRKLVKVSDEFFFLSFRTAA